MLAVGRICPLVPRQWPPRAGKQHGTLTLPAKGSSHVPAIAVPPPNSHPHRPRVIGELLCLVLTVTLICIAEPLSACECCKHPVAASLRLLTPALSASLPHCARRSARSGNSVCLWQARIGTLCPVGVFWAPGAIGGTSCPLFRGRRRSQPSALGVRGYRKPPKLLCYFLGYKKVRSRPQATQFQQAPNETVAIMLGAQ